MYQAAGPLAVTEDLRFTKDTAVMTSPSASPLSGPPSNNVVLDGSGNGTVSVGPTRPREHWQVLGASVKVSTNNLEARCSIYVGPQVADPYFISTSITGSSGDSCGLGNKDIQSGQQIWAVWTGGDPGSIATLKVEGTYSYGGPPQ